MNLGIIVVMYESFVIKSIVLLGFKLYIINNDVVFVFKKNVFIMVKEWIYLRNGFNMAA